MDQEAPEWLDKSFLATALEGKETTESPVTVVQFSVEPAVEAGNNYTSHLFRVYMEYRVGESDVESTSLIIKAPITKGAISEISEMTDFFAKEPKIYNELLPKMKDRINFEFAPKCFYCPLKNGLVLKDMKEEGYIMCDKLKQLDYSHCKYALENLARFHASSVACYHDNPSLIEAVSKEPMYNVDGLMQEQAKGVLKIIAKTVKENGLEEFADYIFNRTDQMWESLTKICKCKTRGLNVLNHGDMWVNNILFKHNDRGDVIDIKFIDFQISRFTSPALDLLYFIWSSANEDVRENRLQDLFNAYLQMLNMTLEQLGCEERMTEEELQEDLKSSSDWALNTICNLLPLIVCETKDIVNVEEMTLDDFKTDKPDARFTKLYSGKHFKALLPKLSKQFLAWISL